MRAAPSRLPSFFYSLCDSRDVSLTSFATFDCLGRTLRARSRLRIRNFFQEWSLLALSSRTGADRERQQRIGYDAFAEPTMNERYLRTADDPSR